MENPSGKLPVTFPLTDADAKQPCSDLVCNYNDKDFSEGVKSGWQVYFYKDVAYRFGHGLSYTDFEYTVAQKWTEVTPRTMIVTIRNVGDKPGREVAQLYVNFHATYTVPFPV